MTSKVYVLVGHIASGKSTYCKNAATKGQIIVNDDSIVNMLHGGIYHFYDKKLKTLYKTLENNAVSLSLCLGKSVVIDRGVNVNKHARQRFISLARSFDVVCEAIVFPFETPEIHAERRTKSDGRGYNYDSWLEVANRHFSTYDAPTKEEGFNAVHLINFNQILQGMVIS